MSDPHNSTTVQPEDLPGEVEKRKLWFYECQLRWLNLDAFRGITELDAVNTAKDPFPDKRINIIAEPLSTGSFPGGMIGGKMKNLGPVYLDDQEPVWTPDEGARRHAWEGTFIGRVNNWLGYKSAPRLAAKLAGLRQKYEQSPFSSLIDLDPDLITHVRKDPGGDAGKMGRAVSRAMLADAKPWLIPELYNSKNIDSRPIKDWIGNLDDFIHNFESDLTIAVGGTPGQPVPGDPLDGDAYRTWIKFLIEASSTRDGGESLKAKLLTEITNPADKSTSFARYDQNDINIQTAGFPMAPVTKFPFCDRVTYWTGVLKNSLGEVYVSKPNADMGLCLIMRTLYLLGTLPATLGSDADLIWRKRSAPGDNFSAYFAKRSEDPTLKDNEDLRKRFQSVQAKLQVILEETASHPRAAAATFSPLAQEVARQAIHAFKFWMDETPRVKDNAKLLQARDQTGIVSNDKEKKAEMEYWSENHYIMFASSEFLAGQLWESDTFQPCKEFLDPNDKSNIRTGKDRKERGKARVLKWLNNRLMFGWTEFNSSGYYREHLWALLNLADFSLDREVREKAKLAVDLMLFDVARFLHKGTMGAAGGRSQFKSKGCGWDNALCDVVEILFGSRGIFSDDDSQIGMSLATSTYKPPEVLLEIGSNPPATSFTDRSRVSVTFEEAPKYGIGYSKQSDQKDSVMQGYAPKRAQHYQFLDSVNREITRTHSGYGVTEDNTVFWWATSAFYNKQVVRNTFNAVNTFGLQECQIFHGALPTLIKLVSGYEKLKHRALLGGIVGTVFGAIGTAAGALVGVAEGLAEDVGEVIFKDDSVLRGLEEAASDDLSVLLEGSTRTRANILSFRNRDIMLSSIQNFRAGQLNLQSSVCQASINPAVNVFITAGLEDIDISNLDAGIGGGLLGAALGTALSVATGGAGGVLIAGLGVIGAAVGVGVNEGFATHQNLLVDHDDGPGWWTGNWALPMIVQHGSAAILAYDFHTIQNLLAKSGSHTWFPKVGFDRVDQMRTSAYDDANFPLLDIGDIGPKGFWLFGKMIQPATAGSGNRSEAYIGVFSNQRPKWQDQDSDFYKEQIKETARKPIKDKQGAIGAKLDDLEDSPIGSIGRDTIKSAVDQAVGSTFQDNIDRNVWLKAAKDALAKVTDILVQDNLSTANDLAALEIDLRNMQRVWPDPLPQDYFADRDWYVEGKNVWIIQVGSQEEFGDFHNFKDRVSSARVHLDDAGDLECSYDIPSPGGSSERLTLAYGDGGRFSLNGSPFQTDLYPRFENPFIRGGKVEWGQREYVIEYRGKSLLHDFSKFDDQVIRVEQPAPAEDEQNLVKALVIFFKTEDENMDAFTVATADVTIGCTQVTKAQVVAAGPSGENTIHDAEWIFFDSPASRQPDMSIVLTHPPSSKGDSTPHWKMSFSLFALMGDRVVRSCSLSGTYFDFVDDKRTTDPFPFTITLLEWREWEAIPDGKTPVFWMLARHPGFAVAHYDYNDLLAIDPAGQLWHRRLKPCPAEETGWFAVTQGGGSGPNFAQPFFAAAVSWLPTALILAVQSQGTLFLSSPAPSGEWTNGWKRIDVWTFPDLIFGIPDTSGAPIPVALSPLSVVAGIASTQPFGGAELTILGADGNFYSRTTLLPDDTGAWRKIDVTGFTALSGAEFVVTGDFLLALASDRSLWAAVVDHGGNHSSPAWEKVSPADFAVGRFAATSLQGSCQIVAATTFGTTRAATYRSGSPTAWVAVDLPNVAPAPGSPLASAAPAAAQARFFAIGADNKVYSIDWDSSTDWTPGQAWSEVAPNGKGIEARLPGAGIAAVSRVSGLVEVFTQSKDGSLVKAWWS